jgi:hypothetical protein
MFVDVKITRSEMVQSPAMGLSTPVLRRQRLPRVLAQGAKGYQTLQCDRRRDLKPLTARFAPVLRLFLGASCLESKVPTFPDFLGSGPSVFPSVSPSTLHACSTPVRRRERHQNRAGLEPDA